MEPMAGRTLPGVHQKPSNLKEGAGMWTLKTLLTGLQVLVDTRNPVRQTPDLWGHIKGLEFGSVVGWQWQSHTGRPLCSSVQLQARGCLGSEQVLEKKELFSAPVGLVTGPAGTFHTQDWARSHLGYQHRCEQGSPTSHRNSHFLP